MNMKAIFAASIIAASAFVPKIVVAADYNPQNSDPDYIGQRMQFKGNLGKFLAEYEQNYGIKPSKELVADLKACVKDPRCYKGE